MRSCPACFVNLPLGRRLGMIGPGTWRVHQILCHWKGKCPRISNMSLGSNTPCGFLDFLPCLAGTWLATSQNLTWNPKIMIKRNLLFEEYQSSGSIAQVSRNLWFLILIRVFRGFVHVLWPFPIHGMISNWHKNPARMAHLSLGRCRCTVAQVCIDGEGDQWKTGIQQRCLYQDENVFFMFFHVIQGSGDMTSTDFHG